MKIIRHLKIALIAALICVDQINAEESISLNFVNADVESVVKAVSQATGRSFLIDPRVKGTVSLISGSPVQPALALDILASALRLQGFALVETNGVLKVLPEIDAKTQAGIASRKNSSGRSTKGNNGIEIATRVFQIRNESAAQLVPVLRPLIAANNSITAYPANNTLVITDYTDNLERLEKIIESIDVSPDGEIEVIPVKYASAGDIAQTLNRLYSEDRSTSQEQGQRAAILADIRSNSVIVRSDNRGKLARLRNLVKSLDSETTAAGNIHVVRLKHAEATELAQVLRTTIGTAAESGSVAGANALTGLTPTTANATPGAGIGNGNANPAKQLVANHSSSIGNSGLSGGSLVQADIATNSLIITASDPVFKNLRTVIDQLDRRRAQVHIEALIVELTAEKASEFGFQWQHLTGSGGTRLVGGTNFGTGGNNIIGLMENIAKAGDTGVTGIAPGLNIGVLSGNLTLSALLRALETDNRANILSTPSVVTLDNETAHIVVGQNVPFITGSYAQTGNTVSSPFQTYERRDVGLSLRVKPMVTDGGVVRIQIYQEASSLQAASLSNNAGPITNKRALESTVLVDDGSVIVLGGLIDDRDGAGEEKVPFLGDTPLIGGLFKYETRKRSKTNLMVFLRPQIIRDASGYETTTSREFESIAAKQRSFAKDQESRLGGGSSPQLPEYGRLQTQPATTSGDTITPVPVVPAK